MPQRDLDFGCGQLFGNVVSRYVKPDCMKHDIEMRGVNKRRFSFDNPQQGKAEVKQAAITSDQRAVTANMMALKAWPTFLVSEEYENGKQNQEP